MKILVVGDVIIDRYVTVAVDRISPEAPVPVMRFLGVEERSGGAANVASNIASLGSRVVCHPLCGEYRNPPVKTRFVTERGQQIARLDEEETHDIDAKAEEGLLRDLSMTDMYDAVVISDYCKGIITPRIAATVISKAIAKKVPVIVDTKRADWTRFTGATLIKGTDRDLQGEGPRMVSRYVLITRGEKNAHFYDYERQEGMDIRVVAQDVVDVTGAGDTVVAAIAVRLAHTTHVVKACEFAMKAAAVVVAKHGTATATLAEIENFLRR